MKLKVYGTKMYEVCKEYRPFVIDSKEFPELELEMEAVAEASFMGDQPNEKQALENLYAKMHDTRVKGSTSQDEYQRGETIMSFLGAFEEDRTLYSDEETTFNLMAIDHENKDS
jgi:hypothetical protein